MKNKLNKIIAILLTFHLILGGVAPVFAEVEEIPEIEETNNEAEEVAEIESSNVSVKPANNEVAEIPETSDSSETSTEPTVDNSSNSLIPNDESPTPVLNENQDQDGKVGDTYINTGDGSSNGTILTDANTNLSTGAGCCDNGGGVSIVNDGNGSKSDNNGSAVVVNDNTTDQNNSANIDNGLTGVTVTGQNSASNNLGDSSINSGNANTTGTIITSANTNVDGLAISEFNIVDDHTGDFILDFGANCISGCDGFTNLANTNNGSGSTNDTSLDSTTNNTTNQLNDGVVNNDLYLTSDSGNNAASGNTNGNNYIITGDASVVGNVLTMLNNNLAGNVIYGVVNIFGDLIGDIILPESALNAFACATCGGNTSLINSGNGSGSDNNNSSTQTVNNIYDQINVADINNNLILDATTGGNSASGNTGGDAYIKTGEANVIAQVLNIANTNLIGGDMWLVIINRAGRWVGQIVGTPTGSMFAGSEGTEFSVDENGEISVVNSGNGSGSTNNGSLDSTVNNTTNQKNIAEVNNDLHLSANTGKNSTNDNTGGDSYITTGDAEVIANLVNFVNNNIVGGRLLVTFVNVFGDWTGNFITPGQQKLNTQQLSQGGLTTENTNVNTITQNNTTNNPSTPSNNGGGSNTVVAAAGFFPTSSNESNNSNQNTVGMGAFSVAVAGINNTQDVLKQLTKGASTKDKTKINLAWLILLTPLFALAILGRKFYTRFKSV